MQGSKVHITNQEASIQWIMKRGIKSIMEIPTKDQIYDNISFKLGAFYKGFWQNKKTGLKQSTRKPGEMILMAENMKQTSRQDDRYIKVCSYVRDVKKFQSKNYQTWKQFIWLDLLPQERKIMENYVELLTPPILQEGQPKDVYQYRQKEKMFSAYKKMNRGMLLVQIFEKIWTIRQYRKNKKYEDEKRHLNLTKEIIRQINKSHPNFRGFLNNNLGKEELDQLRNLMQ